MKKYYIHIDHALYKKILSFLFKDENEHAVFLYSKLGDNSFTLNFHVQEYYFVPDDEIDNSSYDLSLTDEGQAKIIKRAWETKSALIEIHSHPFAKKGTKFSYYDLEGFKEFVPHIWWRLKHSPYIALVFGKNDYDALVWVDNPDDPVPLTGINIGNLSIKPTNNTIYFNQRIGKL